MRLLGRLSFLFDGEGVDGSLVFAVLSLEVGAGPFARFGAGGASEVNFL